MEFGICSTAQHGDKVVMFLEVWLGVTLYSMVWALQFKFSLLLQILNSGLAVIVPVIGSSGHRVTAWGDYLV